MARLGRSAQGRLQGALPATVLAESQGRPGLYSFTGGPAGVPHSHIRAPHVRVSPRLRPPSCSPAPVAPSIWFLPVPAPLMSRSPYQAWRVGA